MSGDDRADRVRRELESANVDRLTREDGLDALARAEDARDAVAPSGVPASLEGLLAGQRAGVAAQQSLTVCVCRLITSIPAMAAKSAELAVSAHVDACAIRSSASAAAAAVGAAMNAKPVVKRPWRDVWQEAALKCPWMVGTVAIVFILKGFGKQILAMWIGA